MANQRMLWEVVEVTQDCEVGKAGERAVVVELDGKYMTMVFTARPAGTQKCSTGADYRYLRTARDRQGA